MSVKLGGTFSRERKVPGGSPQGSILGNYLFCATTNSLTQDVNYVDIERELAGEMEFGSVSMDGGELGLGGEYGAVGEPVQGRGGEQATYGLPSSGSD